MLIAAFTRATGLSRATVRFYVKRGLLHPVIGAGGSNRYQSFDADQVERALIIRNAQALGFTLKEIAALDAEYNLKGMTRQRKAALMMERVALIDEQMAKLHGMRRYLMKKVAWIEAGEKGVPPTYDPAPNRRISCGDKKGPPTPRARHNDTPLESPV
jgi:MerR family transcriptional regulator, copper efflux regulator